MALLIAINKLFSKVEYQYEEYDAIFNTLPHERRVDGTTNHVDFDETMIMSPYLLALVISEYQTDAVSDTAPDTNTLIRVHAPEYINNDKLGEYGLKAAAAIIDGFSDYFGFNYADAFAPGRAKSDQIGIPDFAAGAMENWGLVTYQYYLIYVNDVDYVESAVASVAEVVAHELTHQWTGNLITCEWWDEIWINEAFADIGGYLGLRYAEPSWNWESEFTVHELYGALRADAMTNSRPLINKQNNGGAVVESPQQINRQFDGIAYAKGGSINRMVMGAMEERRWQAGMRDYLTKNAYTATNGEIYFDHMQTALDENKPLDPEWDLPFNFNQTFDAWHRQMGYPIITIEVDNGVLKLSQERFLHRGNRSQLNEPASNLDYRWNVPIFYVNAADEYKLDWMTTTEDLSLRGFAGADIWLDPESTAFARFHFGTFTQLSETISNMIKRNVGALPPNYFMSIAKMISDQFYIYTAEIDYGTDIWHLMETTRLVATSKMAHESHMWPVWFQMDYIFARRSSASATGAVTTEASINKLMMFSPDRQVYQNYMNNLATDQLVKYLPQFDYSSGDVKHDLHMMAKYLVPFHCELDNAECLSLAKSNFDKVKNGEMSWDDINVNIRSFSLLYGMRNGDESDIKWLEEQIFAASDDSAFFRNGIKSLSYTKLASDAIKILERIRKEVPAHFEYAVEQFAAQFALRDEVIIYLTVSMGQTLNESIDVLASNIDSVCTYVHTKDDAEMIDQLKTATLAVFDSELPPLVQHQFEKCEARLEINRHWHAENGSKIVLWLRYFGNKM